MPFPERLLQPGEEVLIETRPRLVRLARPVVLVVVVLGASVAAVVSWASAPIWFGWVLLGAIGSCLLNVACRAAQWRAEGLTITSRRVVWRAGVLRRVGREIPLVNVQSVTYRQGLGQRMLRSGDLVVEAAGEGAREPIPDVPDPARVQSVISAAMERSRTSFAWSMPSRHRPVTPPAGHLSVTPPAGHLSVTPPAGHLSLAAGEPALGAPEVVDALERLAALYERGVLTRDEFEAAKAELLARR